MQLDKTHVKIRVRTLSEIGDLSLLMVRRYPRAFFHAFFMGAIFWILVDAALLGWIPWRLSQEAVWDEDSYSDLTRYILWVLMLATVQMPLAGVFSTYYLGQAVFEQRPTLGRTLREVFQQAWLLIGMLGIWRLAIPLTVWAGFRMGQPTDAFLDFVLPILLLVIVSVIRGNRPFVPEMIVLEKCPYRTSDANQITLSKRSKALHSPMAGELGSRFLIVAMVNIVLLASLYFTMVFCRGIALNRWTLDLLPLMIFLPASVWLVGSLSVFVRILGYLDTRIRLEGWEVELAIRAEAIRQFGSDEMVSERVSAASSSGDPSSKARPLAEATV